MNSPPSETKIGLWDEVPPDQMSAVEGGGHPGAVDVGKLQSLRSMVAAAKSVKLENAVSLNVAAAAW